MKRYLHLWIIAGLAFFLSALTVPMSFLAEVIDVSYDYDTRISSVIRFIWNWGIDLPSGTNLSEPLAELLMYTLNFLFYCVVFCLAYRASLLIRNWREFKAPTGRPNPAQGNALGMHPRKNSPERAA